MEYWKVVSGYGIILTGQEIEKIETEIKRVPSKQIAEAQINAFKIFLSKL